MKFNFPFRKRQEESPVRPKKPQDTLAPVIPSSRSELVFGLVYASGTKADQVSEALIDFLHKYHYETRVIRISEYIEKRLGIELDGASAFERIDHLIKGGNSLCQESHCKDFLALAAIAEIAGKRNRTDDGPAPSLGKAYIVRSLKRPEEVDRLRHTYRPGFYLVGVFSSEEERRKYFDQKGIIENTANDLIARDQKESEEEYGQRTRDTFHRADVFVQVSNFQDELKRFLRIVFGDPFETPTPSEHAMFLAAAAATRSAQFGRQVGAAILDASGDLLSIGCNEVPTPVGGLYWPPTKESPSFRDHELSPPRDSNDRAKEEIETNVVARVKAMIDKGLEIASGSIGTETILAVRKSIESQFPSKPRILKPTKLFDITEFGRAVHAEMEAILCCGRTGRSPRGGTLYTTTFPCHNCTRHIIASGLKRVVYIEPYPKSRAEDLHGDAIKLCNSDGVSADGEGDRRIPFVPFVGIGPRRFLDLFSLELTSGRVLDRKLSDGNSIKWSPEDSSGPRVPMSPASYLDREEGAVRDMNKFIEETQKGEPNGHKQE
jgi:deoxycytidylate deaminase